MDGQGPTVGFSLPPRIGGRLFEVTGTAQDDLGQVASVEIKLDDGGWQPVTSLAGPDPSGVQRWRYAWSLPNENGVQHTLRVRATDPVGNPGAESAPQTTTVSATAVDLAVTVTDNQAAAVAAITPIADPAWTVVGLPDGG